MRASIPGFLTSRGYRAARTRRPSDREIREEQLIVDLREVHRQNYAVYGVKKMHKAMKCRGWHLGLEQTRRLMRKAGLRGVQRGKPVFTTVTDPAAARPADLVNRHFKALAANRLWVADIKFVRTWQGFCYAAFVTDACTKKIAGCYTTTTNSGPTKVAMHAVGVAVELGNGNGQQALDRAARVRHAEQLSPGRQARYLIDDIEALNRRPRLAGLRELRQRFHGLTGSDAARSRAHQHVPTARRTLSPAHTPPTRADPRCGRLLPGFRRVRTPPYRTAPVMTAHCPAPRPVTGPQAQRSPPTRSETGPDLARENFLYCYQAPFA